MQILSLFDYSNPIQFVLLEVKYLNNCSSSALRMELLDGDTNGDLIQTLSGILMIMPQTNAFKLLRDRLACLPTLQRWKIIMIFESKFLDANFSPMLSFICTIFDSQQKISTSSTRGVLSEFFFNHLNTHQIDFF